MLLGDADVERPLGELLGDLVEPGARRHRRGDRDDLLVALHLGAQRLGEDARIARRARRGLGLHARHDVELDHAVIFVGAVLGRRVALALLGDDMDQHRPDVGVADVLEHFDQRAHVVPVDRPDIIKAELVEERAAGEHAAGIFLHLARRDVQRLGHRPRELLRELARRQIFARADTSRASALRSDADRRRDRHVVVVEDDDQPVARRRGIVHRLIGHAGATARRRRSPRSRGPARPTACWRWRSRARPRSRSSCAPRRTGRIRSRCAG